MGQYYKAVALSEKAIHIISPCGYKLMEHSRYWNRAVARIEKLLTNKPYRVMRIWDYSECAPFVWHYKWQDDWTVFIEDEFKMEKEWNVDDRNVLEREPDKIYYLINETRHEYINMNKQEVNKDLLDEYEWVVHPLPLLTRARTQEAWWDYHWEMNQDKLWLWCWDLISIRVVDEPIDDVLQSDNYQDMTKVLTFKE